MRKAVPCIETMTATTFRSTGSIDIEQVSTPIEAPLAIEVNDHVVAHLMRLPGHDAELALGFCVTEGYISGMGDVLGLDICHENDGKVGLRTSRDVMVDKPLVLTSACVGRGEGRAELPKALETEGWTMAAETLLAITGAVLSGQELHSATGAVHAAAVFTLEGEMVALREDVGRHNAVDKVIGSCVYEGCPLHRSVLVSTGRASSEMVLKATTARVPIVASLSGPTSLGAELAEKLGITLVCYLRRSRMAVYTRPERIAAP